MRIGGETSQPHVGGSPHAEGSLCEQTLIGSSPAFGQVVAMARAVAGNDCVVILEGESGTGKELLARWIHAHSSRHVRPFIPVNCAGISETLFESQFFGHVRGAFTGAVTETLGVVRAAEGGTLLLDEVSEIPLHLQPKLLRLIQEREIAPVGGARPLSVNVRFVASTNKVLWQLVKEGKFRPDLYHRLNVVRIDLPPLRERPEDIVPLLEWYLQYYATEYGMPNRQLGEGIRKQLVEYSWPGNVRELCSYVERLYAADLPPLPPALGSWEEAARGAPPPLEPQRGASPRSPTCPPPAPSPRWNRPPSYAPFGTRPGTVRPPPGCSTCIAPRC